MSDPNPLLADLESERHQILLEKGNTAEGRKILGLPPPKQTGVDWREGEKWISNGYVTHVSEEICRGCGSVSVRLAGIFHRESSDRGNKKVTRLDTTRPGLSLPQGLPSETIQTFVHYCAECA